MKILFSLSAALLISVVAFGLGFDAAMIGISDITFMIGAFILALIVTFVFTS